MPLISHRFFRSSLWAALLTAIMCAVMPGGLPATRSVGSAFDPSTTIVALRSKPPVVVRAQVMRSDGDGAAPQLRQQQLPSAAATDLASASAATPSTALDAFLISSPPDPGHYARPPPAP